jgi:hypothetical protein
VRLNFNNANGQPIIDNLAISATLTAIPEPGSQAAFVDKFVRQIPERIAFYRRQGVSGDQDIFEYRWFVYSV